MKSVTVKRSEWLRGTGEGSGLFVNGKRCCLGFAVQQLCNKDDNYLAPILTPYKEDWESMTGNPYKHVTTLVLINDRPSISDTTREALIIESGRETGLEFSFVD